MVIKTGDTYIFSFNTQSAGGTSGEDSPKLSLKDRDTNKYYNGITFQDTQYFFEMTFVSNYNYVWQAVIKTEGNFLTSAASSLDPTVTKTEQFEVYSPQGSKVAWVKNNQYSFFYGSTGAAKITIQRAEDNYYYTGSDWDETKTELTMTLYSEGLYKYDFTPATEDTYTCICQATGEDELVTVLNVFDSEEDIATVKVTSDTLVSPTGGDCKVIEYSTGIPISGATVDVYTYAGKERVAHVATNSDGTWECSVKPGTYSFIIKKDGYESETFTRTV